jgi:hypothetical protein
VTCTYIYRVILYFINSILVTIFQNYRTKIKSILEHSGMELWSTQHLERTTLIMGFNFQRCDPHEVFCFNVCFHTELQYSYNNDSGSKS